MKQQKSYNNKEEKELNSPLAAYKLEGKEKGKNDQIFFIFFFCKISFFKKVVVVVVAVVVTCLCQHKLPKPPLGSRPLEVPNARCSG